MLKIPMLSKMCTKYGNDSKGGCKLLYLTNRHETNKNTITSLSTEHDGWPPNVLM